jgi:sugar phosphate isomerase/epimerase
VGCEKCHGASTKHSGDEDNITPPDRMFAHADIDRFCITCHAEEKLRKQEIHKEWLQDEARDDTCNDCHGRFHHLAVRTRRWDKQTGKLIADDGVRMMSKVSSTAAAETSKANGLFARDNLVAWCIVPFDAKKRGPEQRAAMLEHLGFKQLAYDWRAEHVPTFDAELDALHRHGIKLTAFWFPGGLNQDARTILNVLKRHHTHTQLWVTRGGPPVKSPEEQLRRVQTEADAIRPIAEEAAKIGCTVELYNHGGWFGEPENQIAIIERLKMPNVGIVYNLHHGHSHLDRFPKLLEKMLPYLHALNLNGMVANGDRLGMLILPLGQGNLDLGLLKVIRDSGYRGPIGILNHTGVDADGRLQDNLDGLDWLAAQLDGQPAGPKPEPRTWRPAAVGKRSSSK